MEESVGVCSLHLKESDGKTRGAWLLTEIDHWDVEKERIFILTECKLEGRYLLKGRGVVPIYVRYSIRNLESITNDALSLLNPVISCPRCIQSGLYNS